ncbi:hypothetical protein [Botrimarina sp.]|uniref:hypothetical protein n=1 Tax=Botrimarina sp. TaxID=2795802 RepID=UPI0032EC0D48
MRALPRLLFLLTLGPTLLALTASELPAQNLVVNGDFEDGLNDWEWFGFEPNTAETSTDTPSGSGFSADLDIVEPLGLPWLVQDVDISMIAEGETLTLEASVREARQFLPEFDAWIAAQIYMLESSESGAILASGFAFYTNPEWETQSFDVVKPPTANVARVLFTPQNPDFGVGTGRYLIDDVSLTVTTVLPGDYNEDGAVDAADYTVWRDNLGEEVMLPGENPDAATPGQVDQEDYDFWVSQYGVGGGSGAAAAAPEPSAAWLLVAAAMAACAARR